MRRAIAHFARVQGRADDGQWGYSLGLRQRFIDRWRALMGADFFPSLHFLLTGLAPRLGFTLDTVPPRQGGARVEGEDFAAGWGDDVGLALLWVSSTASNRVDHEALVAYGQRWGSVIVTDITQAAGLLPDYVADPGSDVTASTSLKWMCGMPGAGFLHVAEPLPSACQPELHGWFSQANPFSRDLNMSALAPDIRRIDDGTPGAMTCLASPPALDWHADQDWPALRARNRTQTSRILAAADDLDLDSVTPRPEAQRGGSVMIRLGADRPAAQALAELCAEKIFGCARSCVASVAGADDDR